MEQRPDFSQEEGEMQSSPHTILTLAIDAGGTFLKGCLLDQGILLPDTFVQQPSRSEAEAEEIIQGLTDLCMHMVERYLAAADSEQRVQFRIGVAFPGPFDYEQGICLIKGLGKYEQLYGYNIRSLLREELKKRAVLPLNHTWMPSLLEADILFNNDATLFALGVSRHYPTSKLLCLTLGTGLGSAFVSHRQIVQGRDGVPDNGMLYAERFEGVEVDSQFGRRGILALADRLQARSAQEDVHDLAIRASNDDCLAREVWNIYGDRLGRMLKPYVASFQPSHIFIGGQIVKSWQLFIEPLLQALSPERPIIQVEDQVLEHVFYGIDMLFD